jgi:hypothetical protein
MKSFFRHTKAGGYTELCEIRNYIESDDGSLMADSGLSEFFFKWRQAAEKASLPILEHTDFVRMLKEVGFVDITVKISRQPTNPWPKVCPSVHVPQNVPPSRSHGALMVPG